MPDTDETTTTENLNPGGGTAPEPAQRQPTAEEYQALQEENAKYRSQWKPFEKAFADYSPEERQAWVEFAENARYDLDGALERIAEQRGYAITPAERAAAEGMSDEGFDPTTEAITRTELEDRLTQMEEARQVEQIEDHARRLGYDPGSADWDYLLVRASREGGDLDKAHEMIGQEREAAQAQAVEEYLQRKRDEAAQSVTPPGAAAGVPASGIEEPTNFRTAKMALQERIARQRAAGEFG